MKKIAALVVALVCLAGFSVSSFAYNVIDPDTTSDKFISKYIKNDGSHYSIDYIFPASKLNAEQLAFWNDFMSVITGQTSGKALISMENDNFAFWRFDAGYSINVYDNRIFFTESKDSFSDVPRLRCNAITGAWTGLSSSRGTVGQVLYGFSSISDWPSIASYVDFKGKPLAITDDINEPEEPEEPEEPDPDPEPPESVPDTPKPPPYVPIEPGIPAGDGKYVLYDTGVWKTVINHIKGNMGAAANMGLLVFGFILIWSILRKIFHHFTKV